ncbi:MAG: hypothetical protein DRP56_07190 [Planctomycetota bacterium]|nr:MAG: hypothetical protein DRP56_07190 [Planctomycetota bacterium]
MKSIVITICFLSGLLLADTVASKPSVIDPNSAVDPKIIKAKQVEMIALLDALPGKRQRLETKTYAGTMEDIIANRRVDVVAVSVDANEVKSLAHELVDLTGLNAHHAGVVKSVIEKARRVSTDIKLKKPKPMARPVMDDPNYTSEPDEMSIHLDIWSFIQEIQNDPNVWPSVDDPNYVVETARLANFIATVEEVCSPI